MSIADPIREKGRELHSLARRLSEHLGGRDHQEWSGAEIQGMMQNLHETLEAIEDHLDMDSEDEAPIADPATEAAAATASTAPASPPSDEVAAAPPSPLSTAARRRATELSSGFSFGPPPAPPGILGSGGGGSSEEPSETAHASTLEEFLGRVGDSLITAQRQLDARARTQLAALAAEGGSPDLATLYRIPKVSAELKFALQEVGKGGINLLVYRQGTEASTLNQQTVQFDIAAVPAPPETVAAVRQRAPHLDWVLDAPTRERIREALADVEAGSQSVASSKALLLNHFERVLTVRDPGHEDRFFLAFGDHGEAHQVGAWHLELDPATLTAIYRFELRPKPGEDPTLLRDLVAGLGDRQAELLQVL